MITSNIKKKIIYLCYAIAAIALLLQAKDNTTQIEGLNGAITNFGFLIFLLISSFLNYLIFKAKSILGAIISICLHFAALLISLPLVFQSVGLTAFICISILGLSLLVATGIILSINKTIHNTGK